MTPHIRGYNKAPVTLIEFGDFECPHCGKVFPLIEKLRSRFGTSLKFEFRNFPLKELHSHAMLAAQAAEAAAWQGKFWEMHDLLFRHQDALKHSDLLTYAGEIGLDLNRFESDLRDPMIEQNIRDDVRDGDRWEIEETPGFIINGELYKGNADFESLSAAILRAQDEEMIRIAI